MGLIEAIGAMNDDAATSIQVDAPPVAGEAVAFEGERLASNLARLRAVAWIALIIHGVHVVAFLAWRSAVAGTETWRSVTIAMHIAMVPFNLAGVWLLWRSPPSSPTLRRLPFAYGLAYPTFGALAAGADQLVTTNISPWIMTTFATVLLSRLRSVETFATMGSAFALYLAGQWAMLPSAALRASNGLAGLATFVLALGFAYIFERQERREFDQRRLIERQRAELSAALDEARRATASAEMANRAKSAFLATVSHEIRTPMNGVLGVTELLAQTPLDGDQRQLIETVQESGALLVALINDLLDLSKAEAGRLQLESRPFELAHEVEHVARLFAPQARARGLSLEVVWETSAPPALTGDALRVRQVLSNLVGNAVKFTSRGGVTLRCASRSDGGAQRVSLTVEDTGRGIPAASLARLFAPYVQADDDAARALGGTGLGLAISRQLAQAMGGDVTGESVVGRGSAFRVDVVMPEAPAERGHELAQRDAPRDPNAAPPVSARPSARRARPQQSAGRVLVAEDNVVNQLVLREMLRRLGVEVVLVGDGAAALERLSGSDFDAVLTDMQMPGLSGLELLRGLRERRGDALPVVVLSGGVSEAERKACIEVGANAVLSKPVRLDDLEAALSPFLRFAA